MPRPGRPDQSQQFLWLAIPEICPPGEGIFWLGAGSLGIEYRLAKEQTVTRCELGSVPRHVSEFCPPEPVSPRESPCERARRGTNSKSSHARCAVLPQDARRRKRVSRRVGKLGSERAWGRGPRGAPDGSP